MGELLDPEEWTEIMNGMFERLIHGEPCSLRRLSAAPSTIAF
jgi:hypothetical protein